MTPELINSIVGLAFLSTWVMIGGFLVTEQRPRERRPKGAGKKQG